jgi:prepilin-type N-terminal cleavage/methylation domain-containing protein
MSIRNNPFRVFDYGWPIGGPCPALFRKAALRGFTLTEILLVVAIVVVVGGLGGGLYTGTYKRLLAEKAARQFLLMARYARILAIERRQPFELRLDEDNQGFFLTGTQANEETGQTETTIVRDLYCRPVEFEGEVRFEEVRITTLAGEQSSAADLEHRIMFLPNGSAESAVIEIGDGKSHYTVVVVAATGKARLYPGTAENIRTATIDLDLQ